MICQLRHFIASLPSLPTGEQEEKKFGEGWFQTNKRRSRNTFKESRGIRLEQDLVAVPEFKSITGN